MASNQEKLNLDDSKKCFPRRAVRHWNWLPRDIVEAPTLTSVQRQVGWAPEQAAQAGGVPAHGRWELELDDL